VRIIGFTEGAIRSKGGLGLVGVPLILGSTAARGHSITLVIGGPSYPGGERFLTHNVDNGFAKPQDGGAFGIMAMRAWGTWALAPAILWRLRKYVRTADWVSLHSVYSFPVLAGYLLARLYRKPYGIWPHGVFAPIQRRVSSRIKAVYNLLFANRILKGASVVIYSAAGEREEAKDLGLTTRSVIIPDGTDTSQFESLPPRGRFRQRFLAGYQGGLVLFLGRLNQKKGLDLLIQSMRLVADRRPDTRLAIVGPPDPSAFEHQLREWIRQSGIESHVVVTGAVSHEVKLEALADADIVILPSHAENFGHSVFEAMASSIPVVVSNTINYAEEIARSGAGLAVPRNPESLAEAMLHLLHNPSARAEMGANGPQLARRYSLEDTGRKVERVVESIVHRRPLPADLT
jgi:glycosyltransferase involved in cell wall biosynthesis